MEAWAELRNEAALLHLRFPRSWPEIDDAKWIDSAHIEQWRVLRATSRKLEIQWAVWQSLFSVARPQSRRTRRDK